jgi:hypothetical protein
MMAVRSYSASAQPTTERGRISWAHDCPQEGQVDVVSPHTSSPSFLGPASRLDQPLIFCFLLCPFFAEIRIPSPDPRCSSIIFPFPAPPDSQPPWLAVRGQVDLGRSESRTCFWPKGWCTRDCGREPTQARTNAFELWTERGSPNCLDHPRSPQRRAEPTWPR